MLNRSRDLARQTVSFLPDSKPHSKATIARWITVFTKSVLCHLQNVFTLRDEIEPLLSPEELQIMMSAKHPTIVCIQARLPGACAFPLTALADAPAVRRCCRSSCKPLTSRPSRRCR